MDKIQKALELEKEAQKLRYEVREEERKKELEKEKTFREDNKMDVYTSDDYCGLEAGKYEFYYGYEVTKCPKHGGKCPEECEQSEWAFEAKVDGKPVMALSKTELHPTKNEEPFWYLVAGIGHFLKSL